MSTIKETRITLLRWLYHHEERHPGTFAELTDFIGNPDAITEKRLLEILNELHNKGLIVLHYAMDFKGYAARLTMTGMNNVEKGWEQQVVPTPAQPGATNISDVSVSGSNNTLAFVQHSPGAAVVTTVERYEIREIEKWLAQVASTIDQLVSDPTDREDVRTYTDQISTELAKSHPERRQIREFVGHLVRLLGPASKASLAAAGIFEAGHRIYEALGS